MMDDESCKSEKPDLGGEATRPLFAIEVLHVMSYHGNSMVMTAILEDNSP